MSKHGLGLAAAATLLVAAAPALAATHYASPSGSAANWPCTTSTSPCDLKTAIHGTATQSPATGDQIIVESGLYDLTGTQIVADATEDIEGAPGHAPEIDASGLTTGEGFIDFLWGGELAHVQINENGDTDSYGVESEGGTVFDDDLLSSSGMEATAVGLGTGDKLLDRVAVATGTDGTAVYADDYGSTVTLRNVTAIASNGKAIYGVEPKLFREPPACPTTPAVFSLRNVIAEGSVTIDGIVACTKGDLVFNVDYSDFNPAAESLGTGSTAVAGAHNINAAPVFENAASEEFEEKAGSPTIDKGTNDPQDGALDPDGRARFLGSAPDIGAYEYPAPYPVTGAVTGLAENGAIINGTVDREGSDLQTTYWVQYGTSTA